MDKVLIADVAKKYTEYDLIRSNTDLPEFPNFRTELLLTFLRLSPSSVGHSELFSLVTSLAQLGLDTHDLIPETNANDGRKEVYSRQLKVLAGDYFSSRFYQLLSQAGHIEVTNHLAAAICEVNRLKMNLYTLMRQWKVTADEYIQFSVHIRSQLYLTFTRLLEGVYSKKWPDILLGFTRCEIIYDEIRNLDANRGLNKGWAFWHILHNGTKEERKQLQSGDADPGKVRNLLLKYNVKAQLLQMLDVQFRQLSDKIRQFDSDKLAYELYRIGEPFLRYLSAPRAMEEG
jgi:heptaprenyl diphosphate synthase